MEWTGFYLKERKQFTRLGEFLGSPEGEELLPQDNLPTLRDVLKHGLFIKLKSKSTNNRNNQITNQVIDSIVEILRNIWTGLGFRAELFYRESNLNRKVKEAWLSALKVIKGASVKRLHLDSSIDRVFNILSCRYVCLF